jgi:hypothetical protein
MGGEYRYFETLNNLVAHRMNRSNALANQINFTMQEYWVLRRLFRPLPGSREFEQFLRSLTQRCNDCLLKVVGRAKYLRTAAVEVLLLPKFRQTVTAPLNNS